MIASRPTPVAQEDEAVTAFIHACKHENWTILTWRMPSPQTSFVADDAKPANSGSPMTLDPDCAKVHALYALAKRPPLEEQTPAEAREGMRRSKPIFQNEAPDVAEVKTLSAPGPAGAIPLRLYRPKGVSGVTTGALIYYHGGGWVIGDLESHDTLCRELANGSGHTVISVDYRLAPEHRFPAATDDAIAAARWIAKEAKALGIDPSRLAVGGDSAGGNLAAVVALELRGEIALRFQLLIYPAVDAVTKWPSITRNADVLPLTEKAMAWFYDHYAGGAEIRAGWRASPLLAKDHRGLPPAYVLTAGYDVLMDEGIAYADKLESAGVKVTRRHDAGMIHGFITMGRIIRIANEATAAAAAALKRGLA